MESKFLKFLLFVLIIEATSSSMVLAQDSNNQLPPSIKICSRNLPNKLLNVCLKETMTNIIAEFKNGYRPLDIDPFDPFNLGTYRINYVTGPLVTKVNLKNAISHGSSNLKIRNVRSKITDESLDLELDIYFPKLNTIADYKGRTTFIQLNVRSQGSANVTIYDVTCTLKMIGRPKPSNPKYMSIISFDMTNIRIKQFNINATGIVPDPDLNQLANEFINQNWRQVYRSIIESTRSNWEPIYLEVLNKIFEHVPFDRIVSKD